MRSYAIGPVGLLLAIGSSARAECDDLRNALSSPLSGDITLNLPGDTNCPFLEDGELEEFVVDGGTLTLTGPSKTKFTNLKFTVMAGAGLVFDYAMTEFGPNLGYEREDDYGGYMVQVMSGGSVEFTGEMTGTGLVNMRSVFYNEEGGSIEFASNAVFYDNGNVFRTNLGRLRFYGDVTFKNCWYRAIDNNGGTVRINGDALFMENGGSFNGASGGAFGNINGGTAIFRGKATFGTNECSEDGGAVHNGVGSKMTFYKKADFFDNRCKEGDGGAVNNEGELKFRGAVSAIGNSGWDTGGAIATHGGGSTTPAYAPFTSPFSPPAAPRSRFYGWATIQSNTCRTGGGMSIFDGSAVEFRKPSKVDVSLNSKTKEVGCDQVYVDGTSEIIGYETGDICDEYPSDD